MFKKIKELLAVNKVLPVKEQELKNLEVKIQDKQKLIEEITLEVKKSMQGEREEILSQAKKKASDLLANTEKELGDLTEKKKVLEDSVSDLDDKVTTKQTELAKLLKNTKKFSTESLGIKNLIERFPNAINYEEIQKELETLEESLKEGVLDTIVSLDLHHKDSKLLRQDMTANNRLIRNLLKTYQSRYTTKANLTIYNLMVIGLQAELQNILYTLSYSNVEKAEENAKALINKYLAICAEGNASILPTVTRFLSELEPLFINAIQIEYKYYIQKEKEKEEQRRIKEQMRQEAEERKLLEQERKKIEKEEEKYLNEMAKNKEQLEKETDEGKIAALQARLEELQGQIDQLEEQKEEIVKRANGKAGYVYVISNLGSFGDNTFKIGMTRRLNPLDRIDELGDASVPFKFDVHAMVFSDNAVDLEQRLHQILDKNRVNKINLRKEFFYTNVNELQELVQEIDPTVEFTTTMKAVEYRQSQSILKEEETGVFQNA
ncbi:GIY-YIG nuclease family protein [Fredinandcohnia sp. QZ13]|uniref:GIY-YIG nuclease family protein n=1 Tax=Fredinandcohnia sp. QZ13 TaxID=3073144 RepID=UPI0028534A89|nr:GIY-YIG nuclease family protein [Fredinandcohnia sp. QZ13]MDR4887893.1 GIY-YIG nuclease family protein [Fredinandcohnia sp. QZ13]